MAGVTYTLGEPAHRIDARVEGDAGVFVSGLASLTRARPRQLSHLSNRTYRRFLRHTKATAVILKPQDLARCPTHAPVVNNPYLDFARLSLLFAGQPIFAAGVHASAVVAPSARRPASDPTSSLALTAAAVIAP